MLLPEPVLIAKPCGPPDTLAIAGTMDFMQHSAGSVALGRRGRC